MFDKILQNLLKKADAMTIFIKYRFELFISLSNNVEFEQIDFAWLSKHKIKPDFETLGYIRVKFNIRSA